MLCEWHIPEAHYLETWGDIRGHDGTVTIQQPLIAPLYGGKSAIELLAAVDRIAEKRWVRHRPGHLANGQFDRREEGSRRLRDFWQEAVRAGVVPARRPQPRRPDSTGSGPSGLPARRSRRDRPRDQLPRRPDSLRRPLRQ